MSNILPPEFQIRETQVTEFTEPNPDVFYPNNQGGTGWAPMPPRLDRQVGMDPAMRYGQDSAAAAAQSGADAVRELVQQSGVNQINTTRVLDREGGSSVTFHEPSRDEQVSMVHGQAISGDPETISQALAIGDRPTSRLPVVAAQQARDAMNRNVQGMNESTKMAFLEMMRQKGSEAIESVSTGINEALGTQIVKSTDSGVPWYDALQGHNPALLELKEIMRYHGERQRKGAARPAAKYHPSQSNYQSRHGTFATPPTAGGLGALPSITTAYRQQLASVAQATTDTSDPVDAYVNQAQPLTMPKTRPDITASTFAYKTLLRSSAGTTASTSPAPDVSTEGFVRTLAKTGVSASTSEPPPYIGERDAEVLWGDRGSTAGNGDEDSWSYVADDGIAYEMEEEAKAGLSKNMKIGLAVAAGVGLILLLRG